MKKITFSVLILLFSLQGLMAQDYSMYFNGTTNYASKSTTSNLAFSSSFTIEMWVKMPKTVTYSTERILVEYGNSWASGTYQLTSTANNNFKLNFNGRTGTEPVATVSLNDDTWHHLAGVFDDANNMIYLYFDGVLSNSAAQTGNPTAVANQPLNLARRNNGTNYSNVTMDEVRIWNSVRTPAQIQANMNVALAGTETGLKAYYKMNQASGATLYDATSNANNLTFSGTQYPGYTAKFSGGSGTAGSPYIIATLGDLKYLSEHSSYWASGTYLIQTANIDASPTSGWNGGLGFIPIGNSTTQFSGSYNGQGFAISGLFINRPTTDYIGLFGRTNSPAAISNLGITGVNITGQMYTGGLVGFNFLSTLSNSYCTGIVASTTSNIGGLVGWNQGSTISKCYSTATVTGTNNCGGFVGVNRDDGISNGLITDCYSIGNLTFGSNVGSFGGFAGVNASFSSPSHTSTIQNCYSTGSVANVDTRGFLGDNTSGTYMNNFWDKETSGQLAGGVSGAFATGKTSAEMKLRSTFTGWDFTTGTGIWKIKEIASLYISYPYLPGFTYDEPGASPVVNPIPGLSDLYYSGGIGTLKNPYQIATLADLKFLSEKPADWAKYFIQTADIDATTTSGWNSGAGFSPIGNDPAYFKGNYNGQNHKISNLFMNRISAIFTSHGLFGETDGATIQNLGLENVNITGFYAGALVGTANGTSSSINNCWATGSVVGNEATGGLIGTLEGNLSYAHFNGSVSSFDGGSGNTIGGLVGSVGSASDGHVTYSYSLGTVTFAEMFAGGFVGYASRGTISDCYSLTDVSCSGGRSGGFVGQNLAVLFSRCYSAGHVENAESLFGGFCGYDYDNTITTSCFWDTETSGQKSSDGGTGKSTTQMKTQGTFTGWNFTTGTGIWAIETFSPAISYPYLRQNAQSPVPGHDVGPAGSGTIADPFQIASLHDLKFLSERSFLWSAVFIQTANIDATPTSGWNSNGTGGYYGFSPVGNFTTNFTGKYDGQNYTISHLYINRPAQYQTGLYGICKNATIKNIHLSDFNITGQQEVGGLAGSIVSGSTVANCSAKGTLTSTNYPAGGLAGYVDNAVVLSDSYSDVILSNGNHGNSGGFIGEIGSLFQGNIDRCYSLGSVTGTGPYLGGFIGYGNGNNGHITNCYSMTTVQGGEYAGGFYAYSYYLNTVNCYAAGAVTGTNQARGFVAYNDGDNVFANCFWDTQTSGQYNSDGGTGKSTAEMKTQGTFTGWDFTTGTGIWEIETGSALSYPYLRQNAQSPVPGHVTVDLTGSGTTLDPYQITNLEDLRYLSGHSIIWSATFIQTTDIDASATKGWNGGKGFICIGNYTDKFSGKYNGQNHIIANLFQNNPSAYGGVFGYVDGCLIQNLGLTSVNITSKTSHTGGLVGSLNNGTVENCYVTGTLNSSDSEVGGLVGYADSGTIDNCNFNGSVVAVSDDEIDCIGGLVGRLANGSVTNCNAKGSVTTSAYYTAGLIGYTEDNAQIRGSYSDVVVSVGDDGDGAGFIGGMDSFTGSIDQCYSLGSVTGTREYLGGFIGQGQGSANGLIKNCYSLTNVNGGEKAGGFYGYSESLTTENCYAAGAVTGTSGLTGGFAGYDYGGNTSTNSFWDVQTSGQPTSVGNLGTPKSTSEMKTLSTFTGWDFSKIWNIESGNSISYPYLRDNVQSPAPGQISKPGAPTSLAASPGNNSATISFTAGSNGGFSITNYEYSTDNGVSFTACSPAVITSPVTITGLTNGTTYQVKLRAVSILGSGTASDAVNVQPGPPCANPTNGGTIATDQRGEAPFDPAAFTSTTGASGQTGTLEYKWQSSTTSGSTGFGDISSSNSDTYNSGALSVTTWFKRLARVGCMSDWNAAMESNVLKVNILNLDTEPAAQPTDLYFSNSKTTDKSNIILSYTASASARGYLIVRKTGAAPSFVPVDGTSYALGIQGADEIVYSGSALSATDLNVTLGAQYYYKVYAFNGSGNGCNYLTLNPLSGISTCFSQNTGSLSNNSGLSVSAGFPNVGVNVTFPNGTIGTTLNATKTSNTPASNFSVLPGVRGVSNLYFTITSSVPSPGSYTMVLDFSLLGLTPSQWGTFKILKRTNSSSTWVDIAGLGGTITNRQTDGAWGKFTISGLSSFSDFAGGQAANTWTVTSASETGPGTLKQLVSGAVAGDFINFNVPAMGTNTITFTTPVVIDKDLTIEGAASGIVLDGNHVTEVLDIHSASDPQPAVRLEKLTITKGNDSGNVAGGIDNMGNLTMVNCLVVDNTDIDYLDGAGAVGGIFSSGSLTMVNCTIAGNTGAPAGLSGLEGIGGLYCTGELNVYNTIIYGNTGYYHSMAYSSIKESYNSLYEETQNVLTNSNSVIFIQALPALDNLFGKDPQFVGKYYVTANPYLIFGGSPCTDAGNDSYCFGTTDIRGGTFGRKLDKATGGTGTIDIGAYEWKTGTDPNLFAWTGATGTSWNIPGNWNVNAVPAATDNIVVPNVANKPVVNELPGSPAVCNNLDIMSGAAVTIAPGKALSVNGVLTNHAGITGVVVQSTSGAFDGTGSLINGTAGVQGTVERFVSGDLWHLISPAATAGETVASFVDLANGNLVARNATNYALAPWLEGTGKWDYYKVNGANTSGLFGTPAKGFQVMRSSGEGTGKGINGGNGKLTFKGTLAATDMNIAVTKSGYGWNLIGNPYPCALDVTKFITANTPLLDQSYLAIYVSNIGDVDVKGYSPVISTAGLKMALGEGFYVRTMAGGGSINFTTAMKTTASAAFKGGTVDCPTVQLTAEDGNLKFGTTVKYEGSATKGLDPGKDAGLFNGTASSFSLFTRLIEDNGVDFTVQALPDNNLESMVVPVGLVAAKGATVTFRAMAANIPSGYEVVLEDRELGTFTRLDEAGSFYSVTLNATSTGVGRFYLHTNEIIAAIENEMVSGIKVIPNPEQHLVRIVGNFDLPARAMVYDMNGKLVATSMLTSQIVNDIQLTNYSSGVYLLRIESGNKSETRKFVWKRK